MGDRFDSSGAVNRVGLRDDFKKGLRCFNSSDYEGALLVRSWMMLTRTVIPRFMVCRVFLWVTETG